MTIPEIIESAVTAMRSYEYSTYRDEGDGAYIFTLKYERDFADWRVGARIGIRERLPTYYYGAVTAINESTNQITVQLDGNITIASKVDFIMDLNYKHGHPIDIFNQLNDMAQSPDYNKRRWPVIALLQDFEEDDQEGIIGIPIQIIIAYESQSKWTAEQRYDNVFEGKKLLRIYKRFLRYLRASKYVHFKNGDHTKTDRLYWGRDGAFGNEANVAGDLIDAIELNIELKTLKIC